MRVRSWAVLWVLALSSGVACGDDSSLPDEGEGGTTSGGAASGGSAPGGEAGAQSGGAGPSSGGEPTDAGRGPGGAGNGAAGSAGAGGFGADDTERDIELTALAIDLTSKTGVASITLGPSTTNGTAFDAKGLTIRSVTLEGEPLPFTNGPTGLAVAVPASSESLTVVIEYDWRFNTELQGISANGFTLTWPNHCGNVFPCRPHPADGSRFTLDVSGGTGFLVYPRELTSEAPAYMLGWIQGDYRRLTLGTTTAGTRVSMWYLPDSAAAAGMGTLHLVAAFDWLERTLGPYPFGNDVGPVVVDWGPDSLGGMEHHPYWHIAAKSIGNADVNVHEAAHGWFGNGVRLRCWEDLVLSEGTATYLAARVLEEVTGNDATWWSYENDLAARLANNDRPVWYPAECTVADVTTTGLFNRMTYLKGAFFLRALEQKVGRPAFDESLGTFYARFVGRAARFQDLLDVVSEVTDYDPKSCAEAWLVAEWTAGLDACP